jgi:hypothetical protein
MEMAMGTHNGEEDGLDGEGVGDGKQQGRTATPWSPCNAMESLKPWIPYSTMESLQLLSADVSIMSNA